MAKRKNIPRPHNSGTWTEARYTSFIMSALRRAQWPVKYKAIADSYIDDGINPATGRKCKLHRCAECDDLFPQKEMVADHITPVRPVTGFDSWDAVIERLFCEIDGFQAICKDCHAAKTRKENEERKKHRCR